jgi:hypothetical protein
MSMGTMPVINLEVMKQMKDVVSIGMTAII